MSVLLALLLFLPDRYNMEDVAREALQKAQVCSQGVRECGGAIYQRTDGSYYASDAIPGGHYGVDLGGALTDVPAGSILVGDYHIHICGPHNVMFANFFSPADVIVNQGFHTIGYMLSLCDHNVRRYDPRQDDDGDEEVDFHSGKRLYLTIGHIVGWLP